MIKTWIRKWLGIAEKETYVLADPVVITPNVIPEGYFMTLNCDNVLSEEMTRRVREAWAKAYRDNHVLSKIPLLMGGLKLTTNEFPDFKEQVIATVAEDIAKRGTIYHKVKSSFL